MDDELDLFGYIEQQKKQKEDSSLYECYRCVETGDYEINGEIRHLVKGQVIMPIKEFGKPVSIRRIIEKKNNDKKY